MKKNGVTVIQASARLAGAGRLALDNGGTLSARHIILATARAPASCRRCRWASASGPIARRWCQTPCPNRCWWAPAPSARSSPALSRGRRRRHADRHDRRDPAAGRRRDLAAGAQGLRETRHPRADAVRRHGLQPHRHRREGHAGTAGQAQRTGSRARHRRGRHRRQRREPGPGRHARQGGKEPHRHRRPVPHRRAGRLRHRRRGRRALAGAQGQP